jgi:ABC-2 type transport system permease protein
VSAYLALLRARFRMQLQYRAAALAGAATQVFWGVIKICVLEAFYRSSGTAPPLSIHDLITYIWLGQALLALLPWNRDRDLELLVRSGDVVFEWARPLDLYTMWYVRTLGQRAASASLRSVPIFVIAGVLLPLTPARAWALQPPESLSALAGFAVGMLIALLLGAAITTLMHVCLLFTISGEGMALLMPSLVTFFSGLIVPLPLLPDSLQPWLLVSPFAALADLPYRIYCGALTLERAAPALAIGFAWSIALVLLGRALVARAQHRIVVQGG